MTDTIRLGVIGAGIMGERLIRAAQGHASVRVSGVWDPAEAATARLAAALPGLAVCPSVAAAIEGCDCLYIASPPATHLGHARAALAAGRAVFTEKPLATDTADAAAFVSETAGARVAVNFPFASSPAVEQLAGWLGARHPGHAAIEVGFATWPRGWQHAAASWLDGRAEGGFTREVVSHFLFLAHRLLGPLQLLRATTVFPEPGRSERGVTAELLAGGVPVRLAGAVGSTAADDTNSFTVDGAVRLRDWAFAERLGEDGAWQDDPSAMPHAEARPLVLQRQLDGVARMTRGEPHRLATVDEAFAVQTVVEAILQSASP